MNLWKLISSLMISDLTSSTPTRRRQRPENPCFFGTEEYYINMDKICPKITCYRGGTECAIYSKENTPFGRPACECHCKKGYNGDACEKYS